MTQGVPAGPELNKQATIVIGINEAHARTAVESILAHDEIFVAPTDTVFGLFCCYASSTALARIYAAKDRPPQKAIPVLIGEADQLAELAQVPLHPQAEMLMKRFWPGPLTLVLPAQPHLPPDLTAGASTVAVRMPDHAALRRLLAALGPLAATSANRSSQAETHSVEEVLAQLGGRVALVLGDDAPAPAQHDATTTGPGVRRPASTIVDLSEPAATPRILREGPLGADVRKALGLPTSGSGSH